ncbi:WD repeat-containing protein 75 [Bacillus rossius redtenbacheri]|uniref:WD repeat-containing protein 75 n=1 Tax=Bacillus rossius redtenbacheri TaxID=93214 RepID=UPI002FDEBF1A
MENMKFIVKRVTGESLVGARPEFSSNGMILFVTSENVVRAYSTRTGKHVRDYEGLTAKAVGVRLHPSNPQLLLACSQSGELAQWKWETDLPPKVINLKISFHWFAVTGFDVVDQLPYYEVVITFQSIKNKPEKLMVFNSETGECTNKINFTLRDNGHNFAVGGEKGSKFVAGISSVLLYIFNLQRNEDHRERLGGDRVFTCVACHPREYTVAAGDNTGRVLLYQGCLRAPKCVCTVYHWHSLPVVAVAFTHEGSVFFSGGEERVLVKWPVASPQEKTFVPRMADTICHIAVAPQNSAIAVSLGDNGISVLDPQLALACLVQHSSSRRDAMHRSSLPGRPLFPAGLHLDPRSRAVVTNGRAGHLQFLDRQSACLVYNLDVTGMTYLAQERTAELANVDVARLALSGDGAWLATAEQCEEPGKPAAHVRLKFWNFDVVKQNFCLNTSVRDPHFGAVHSIQFQPVIPDEPLMAATSGEDNKLKLWILADSSSIYKQGVVWQCDSVGSFRDLPAGPLSFSADGSVVGAAFGPSLTLWVPETGQLKTSLTHSKLSSAIRHVVFGRLSCCHLACVATDAGLAAWNLLTLTLDWVASVRLSALVPDPRSELVAAISATNQLFLFVPSSSEVLLSQSELLPEDTSVVAAVFAPHQRAGSSYREESQIVFLNSKQELMVLERRSDSEESGNASTLSSLPFEADVPTAFATYLGKQRRTDAEAPEKKLQRHLGEPARQAVRQLLATPAHTMISVARLCQPFLLSFLDTKPKTGQKDSGVASMTEDSGDDGRDSSDVAAPPGERKAHPAPRAPSVPETERMSWEERLEPLLRQPLDWVSQLEGS